MRDIIFRGKRVDNGEWVEGNYIHRTVYYGDPDDTHFILLRGEFDYEYYDAYVVDPETVGQYTGLTDKNGKMIFEGDIVLKKTYNGKNPFPVTFGAGMFHCGFGGGSSTALHRYSLEDRQIEVIGNIYDNNELIVGEKQ